MTIETVDDIERELREYGDRPPPRRAWIDLADRLRVAKQYLEIQFEAQHFVKHGVPLERFNEVVNELGRTRDENERLKEALNDAITDVCHECQYSEDNGSKCSNEDRDCHVQKWRSIIANASGEVSSV